MIMMEYMNTVAEYMVIIMIIVEYLMIIVQSATLSTLFQVNMYYIVIIITMDCRSRPPWHGWHTLPH